MKNRFLCLLIAIFMFIIPFIMFSWMIIQPNSFFHIMVRMVAAYTSCFGGLAMIKTFRLELNRKEQKRKGGE